jgi:putative MATE family efflux protein
MADSSAALRRTDLTSGSIPRHLIAFSLPLLVGNALQALYNTADAMWVGQFVGPEALGAVSAAFPIIMFLVSLLMGVTMATTVLVSQYAGARQYDMVRKTIANSLSLGGMAALVITVVGIVISDWMLVLLNIPDDILDMASAYLKIHFTGTVFMVGYNFVAAALQGLGDSKTPVYFLALAVFLNLVIDPILIVGLGPVPAMGIAGAAIATVASQAVAFSIAIWYLGRRGGLFDMRALTVRLDRALTRKTLIVGLPSGVQQTIVSLGIMAMSSIVNSFGTAVVAAFGAASRLDQFAMMPAMSLGLATSALAGQNIGAGKYHRVRQVLVWSCAIVAGISLCVTAVAQVAPKVLMLLFTSDDQVLTLGAEYLRVVSIGYIAFSLMFVFNSLVRGAGDTIPGMLFAAFNLWGVRVPLARWLSSMPSLGSRGIWIATTISSYVGAAISVVYYLTGRWKRIRLVNVDKSVDGMESESSE